MIDQPAAQEALKQLEPPLSEWILEVSSPHGEPWPGEARASVEWHESRAPLVARSTINLPGRSEKAEEDRAYEPGFEIIYRRSTERARRPGT